ncbi:MAG: sporulation protein YtfJ [Clostridia bacterium]|nr:sporulation protein YtfJ [Clostridia bacterium]
MKNQSASSMVGTTIEKIKDLIDTSTIIGDPIKVSEKVTVIPICSVKYGFASGGSDFSGKANRDDLFGGAGGAGVTINPVAFLVVNDDVVTVKNIGFDAEGPLEKAVNMVPDIFNTVTLLADKFMKDRDVEKQVDEAIENIED